MFCEKCGGEIREGSKFCPKCGAPVTSSQEVPPETVVEDEAESSSTESVVSKLKSSRDGCGL